MLRIRSCPWWFKVLLLVILFIVSTGAQNRSKRLVLKDGTYQAVTKWEIKGDRVRYFSAERYGWEELPKALVDWPATEKYNSGADEESAAQARAQAETDKRAEEAASPTVAPGIRLPDMGGIYVLDSFQGKPSLVELVQSGGEINKNMGKNVLRSIINPLPASVKQTVELKGKRAAVQSHIAQPVIYANINYDDSPPTATNGVSREAPVERLDRFHLIKVEAKGERRVVASLKIALTGKTREQRQLIPAKVEPITEDWLKVVPETPLAPGEYALVEMLTPTQMNLYVWDFGVDPNAPANPTAWKPTAEKRPSGTDESPVLLKRK